MTTFDFTRRLDLMRYRDTLPPDRRLEFDRQVLAAGIPPAPPHPLTVWFPNVGSTIRATLSADYLASGEPWHVWLTRWLTVYPRPPQTQDRLQRRAATRRARRGYE